MTDSVTFRRDNDNRIVIRDAVSGQQHTVLISDTGEMADNHSDDSVFPVPVTETCTVTTQTIRLSDSYGVTIRNKLGDVKEIFGFDGGAYTASDGVYIFEINSPVKSYIRAEGPFEYTHSDEEIAIHFDDSTQSIIGARQWQCYPEESITISDSVADLATAVSYFGDALMTTSPERSFPTLRGHPPEIKTGDSLAVSSSLSEPDTDLTVTVPKTRSAVLTVAPLAYYLLASVEFGDQFTLLAGDFRYEPSHNDITAAVRSILTHCFFLDCIVRTEGLYPVNLKEREKFEQQIGRELNYEKLYNQDLSGRIQEYLSIDTGAVSEVTPSWPVTAVVEPDVQSSRAVPYLLYELAAIRPDDPPRYSGDEARLPVLKSFSQGAQHTRSSSLVFSNEAEFVDVPETESQQTVWVGDGIPLNSLEFMTAGCMNKSISSEERTVGVEVTVACPENTMERELENVQEMYDPRDDLTLKFDVYSGLCTSELQDIIEQGTDYFHFIGHATPDGLECTDGALDVRTVETSNIDTFFLNACQSFHQGTQLVEQGSVGGIVTYSDVSDEFAFRTGKLIVQLLNSGFPVGACLNIIRERTAIGGQYTVVGDHAASLAQPDGGPPYIRHISESGESYTLKITSYTASQSRYQIGSMIAYSLDQLNHQYLVPQSVTASVQEDELKAFLSYSDAPVIYDGDLLTKREFLVDVLD